MKKIFIGVLTTSVIAAITATAVVTATSFKSDQQVETKVKQMQEQKVDGYRFILKDGVVYVIYETDRKSMQKIFSGDEDEFNKLYKAVFNFLSNNNKLSGLNYLSFISTTSKDMKFETANSKEPSQLIFMNLNSEISNWHEIGNWFASRKPEIYNSDFEFFENTKGASRIQWWADKTLESVIPKTGLVLSAEAMFAMDGKQVNSKVDWGKYIPQLSKLDLPKDISFDVFIGEGTTFKANGIESSLKLAFKSGTESYIKAIHPIQSYGQGNWLMNGAMSKIIHYDKIFPDHTGESPFEYKIKIDTPTPTGFHIGDNVKISDLFKGKPEIINNLGGKSFKEWMIENLGGSSDVDDTKIIIKKISGKLIKVEFTIKLKDKTDATKITSASISFELDYTK